jgi:glycosyltransferase involved in cell wall biosynthesis
MLPYFLKSVPKGAQIVAANDGSTDNTTDVLGEFSIPFIEGPNRGVVINKNRLLLKLKDCDHIFIVEDDVLFKKPGWADLFIKASRVSGIQHLTFSPPGPYGKCLATTEFDDIIIQHPQNDGGTLAYYTPKVLEVCGGYCPEFLGAGWGHCEYSERIYRAGLVGEYKNNHVDGMQHFVKLIYVQSVTPSDLRKEQAKRNHKIWKKSQEEKWIKCPLTKQH